MQSQGPFCRRGRQKENQSDGIVTKTWPNIARVKYEIARRLQSKEYRCPLEAGKKNKETNPPLEFPERNAAFLTPSFYAHEIQFRILTFRTIR